MVKIIVMEKDENVCLVRIHKVGNTLPAGKNEFCRVPMISSGHSGYEKTMKRTGRWEARNPDVSEALMQKE